MTESIQQKLITELKQKMSYCGSVLDIPPPVFLMMNGDVLSYDASKGTMEISYPVTAEYMNPFGRMQGGMLAAAIDNTLGPLSMLVAPLNYTRHLEIKYRKAISIETSVITVCAKYINKTKRQLQFSASVFDSESVELATARAVHWIVE
jgi:acyl-coenzyme A thioesterase PaaI-like protein